MASFNISCTQLENGINKVIVKGDLDPNTYDSLENLFSRLFSDNSFKIILDFEKVNGICSAAEGVLIWAQEECKKNKGALVIHSPVQNVKDLMVAFQIDKIITIAENMEQAKQELNKIN